jgi:hypothetical protein
MTVLNVEGEAADEGLLLIALSNQIQPILVLRMQHDKLPNVRRATEWLVKVTFR